jgi:hypothetical protein
MLKKHDTVHLVQLIGYLSSGATGTGGDPLHTDTNSGALRGRERNESLSERFHFLAACRLLLVPAGAAAEEERAVSGTPTLSWCFFGMLWLR